jgi:hypothetical protein
MQIDVLSVVGYQLSVISYLLSVIRLGTLAIQQTTGNRQLEPRTKSKEQSAVLIEIFCFFPT